MGRWEPWDGLDESGYKLTWAPLPHVAGAYVPSHQMIVLDPRETATSQRSALAEELAHLELGHHPVNDAIDTALRRICDVRPNRSLCGSVEVAR